MTINDIAILIGFALMLIVGVTCYIWGFTDARAKEEQSW